MNIEKEALAKWFMDVAKDRWSRRSIESLSSPTEVCGVEVWFELAIDGDWGLQVKITPESELGQWSVIAYEELGKPLTFENDDYEVPMLVRVVLDATRQALGRLEQLPEFRVEAERCELSASIGGSNDAPPKRL